MRLDKTTIKANGEEISCEYKLNAKTNVVILHGAGTSNTTRYHSLAQEILAQDLGVILLDFSGHGKSSGVLTELSLERRVLQAKTVINSLTPENSKIILAGFSMSGQTVCDLLPIFGERVTSILLGCPAAYAREVYDIPFGNPAFTSTLRQLNSWSNSTSFEYLAKFNGTVTIAIGSDDQVIPKGVIKSLKNVAKNCTYIEYAGAPHMLAPWLAEHPYEQAKLVTEIIS